MARRASIKSRLSWRFVRADLANAQAAYAALAAFGVPLQGIRPEDCQTAAASFALEVSREPSVFSPTSPALILTLHGKRVESVIDPATGVKANFISSDLIAAKLAAGRPQDIADVDAIRKATESQGPHPTKVSNAARCFKYQNI